jgi:predicted ATP-grasp superfamily ATP-dependent carboligase
MIEMHVEACQERAASRIECESRTTAHGKVVLYAKRDVSISIDFHDWAMAQSSTDANFCRLADIPPHGEQLRVGQPVLTVLASASPTEIEPELTRRIKEVEERLYA